MRKPDPNAKTNQLVIKSDDPLDVQKFQAVREIVARNSDLTIKKALMPGVDLFLRKHNWPPGNSQTVLNSFGAKVKKECPWCGLAVDRLYKTEFISGLVTSICKGCLDDQNEKTTVKRVVEVT